MLGGVGLLRRRRRKRVYERFLDATVGLIDASRACRPCLSGSGRIVLGAALLRVCEADRALGSALNAGDTGRLEEAAAGLDLARTMLADAGRNASIDAARRRSISLVAGG